MSRNVNSPIYTFVFATVMCCVCSVALAGIYTGTKTLQDKNMKIESQRNVLMAAKLVDTKTPAEVVEGMFLGTSPEVTVQLIDLQGNPVSDISKDDFLANRDKYPSRLIVYQCYREDKESFILPVDGVGLWGPLRGYLAVSQDGDTVIGISFYEQKETPGLGAEILEPWFRNQFKGKKLYRDGKFEGVKVLKGKVESLISDPVQIPHHLDGISGATITSNGVTQIMTVDVKKYLPFLEKNRKSL